MKNDPSDPGVLKKYHLPIRKTGMKYRKIHEEKVLHMQYLFFMDRGTRIRTLK